MKRLTSVLAMAALAVFGGCSGHDESSGYGDNGSRGGMREATTVEMTATAFNPREITVRVGDTVTWRNNSKEIHTVTADPARVAKKDHVSMPQGAKPFHSGEIHPGKTWRMSFTVPGTYKYVCMNHEDHGMMGTVVVKPASTEPSPY